MGTRMAGRFILVLDEGTTSTRAMLFGLDGALWLEIAALAGANPGVRSLDLVEMNPTYDRDGQTARWAAVGIRQFLMGLLNRP